MIECADPQSRVKHSTKPHRTCINGVSVMLCLLAKTMCGRTHLMMPRADPEEWAGVRTPAPWKITDSIGLYKKYAIGALPPGKSWTPWKCWTILLHGISESYSLMIVFFEKAMITGLPLQNKLRTYKKKRRKKNARAFFSQSGLDPPPPTHTHRQTRRKFPESANGYTLSWW